MKKLFALALSALMLVSALVSCAPAKAQLDPAITLASSDAYAGAEWLVDRLDTIPDDVILGVGSNNNYGIDMESFEDDGFIARAIGDEVLLFGKTDAGLDRAVREYAKAVEAGRADELDTVFHEGTRIDKLTIAGVDISEYTVVCEDFDKEYKIHKNYGRMVANAKFAAEELVQLVEKATGITLPIKGEDVKGPMIKIGYITDGSVGETGFEYYVDEDKNLIINGCGDGNGCANGVYHLLEYHCGWQNLIYGNSNLRDADHIDISADLNVKIKPLFDFYMESAQEANVTASDRHPDTWVYKGVVRAANHGMAANEWSGNDKQYVNYLQICYTDNSNYMNTLNTVYTHVEQRENAGEVVGEEITFVDIAQGDNLSYCKCGPCMKMFRDEGNAFAGSVVRFANRLAEDMAAEGYPGLGYLIYAYHGSNKPCKTALHDDVYLTFCTDGACANHPLDGSECNSISFDMAGMIDGMEELNNNDYHEWLAGWDELTGDHNLYVYHYALDTNMGRYPYYSFLRDDLLLMDKYGVAGLYMCDYYPGLGYLDITHMMMKYIMYNPDATEAEYQVGIANIMRNEFGDGYDFVQDAILLLESTMGNGCWNCWAMSDWLNTCQYDFQEYARRADDIIELLELARLECSSAAQEREVEILILEVAYRQCVCTYFTAYDAEDYETIEYLEGRYEYFKQLSAENGFDIKAFPGGGRNRKWKLADNLEEEAWTNWISWRADFAIDGIEQRPVPDEWVTTAAE